MSYRIRRAKEGEFDSIVIPLHQVCLEGEPRPDAEAYWWIVFHNKTPVAFAGVSRSAYWSNAGYLCRCGVIPAHRGHGLQKRLIRVRERFARARGWGWLVTDTRANPQSSNSLIGCGYRIYTPQKPWSFQNALYWRKKIDR